MCSFHIGDIYGHQSVSLYLTIIDASADVLRRYHVMNQPVI